jgi:hypothetical protein
LVVWRAGKEIGSLVIGNKYYLLRLHTVQVQHAIKRKNQLFAIKFDVDTLHYIFFLENLIRFYLRPTFSTRKEDQNRHRSLPQKESLSEIRTWQII